jgi:hypothetical protein
MCLCSLDGHEGTIPFLIRTRGAQCGRWMLQVKDRLLLGRHADCETAGLFAGVAGVSRQHAGKLDIAGVHAIDLKFHVNTAARRKPCLVDLTQLEMITSTMSGSAGATISGWW